MIQDHFENNVKPLLGGCSFEYKEFSGGQFGDLKRIEIEGDGRAALIDIWSLGWLGIDAFDTVANEQILNILAAPEEAELVQKYFDLLVNALNKQKNKASDHVFGPC